MSFDPENKRIFSYIGFAIVLVAIVYFIKHITETADTKLYSEDALDELKDKEKFKELEKLRIQKAREELDLAS